MKVGIVTFVLVLSTANVLPDNRFIIGITALADDPTTYALDQCVLFGVYNRDTLTHLQVVQLDHDPVGVVHPLVQDWLVYWRWGMPTGLS